MTMPQDPFIPGDFSELAANAYTLYAALIQSGFTEACALEIVIRVTVALFLSTAQQQNRSLRLRLFLSGGISNWGMNYVFTQEIRFPVIRPASPCGFFYAPEYLLEVCGTF